MGLILGSGPDQNLSRRQTLNRLGHPEALVRFLSSWDGAVEQDGEGLGREDEKEPRQASE